MEHPRITRLIIGGAATRIYCYIGALRALEEAKYKFKEYVGISAGSIISLLLCIGLTADELEDVLMNYNFRDILHPDPLEPDKILQAIDNWGLDDGRVFRQAIGKFLEDHGFSRALTFEQLTRYTKKTLKVLAADVGSTKYYEFSASKTPKATIVDAIYASCAIPLLFAPAKINENILVDGGLINSFPLHYFSTAELQESIGLKMWYNINNVVCTDSMQYFLRIISLSLCPLIQYKTPPTIISIKVDTLSIELDMTAADKQALIECGYRQVKRHINSRLNIFKERRHSI
jgi:predicted acylesterase/phospholipase RssA